MSYSIKRAGALALILALAALAYVQQQELNALADSTVMQTNTILQQEKRISDLRDWCEGDSQPPPLADLLERR